MQAVYLIPGFFGFASFGEIRYFAQVQNQLERAFAERGQDIEVHYVKQLPTASLPKRAARLAEIVADTGQQAEAIHLIGHSTGGLDARLFASPGVNLPTTVDVESAASRVRSVICVATPNHGAPQLKLFASSVGQALLRTLSLMTVHSVRLGSVPASALLALAGALPRMGRVEGPLLSIVSQVYRQLLRDFDRERQAEIETFFVETSSDQGLLGQLSPEGMELLNAAVQRRPAARYGCVVVQAQPPNWRKAVGIGISPTGQAAYALYRALYRLAAITPLGMVPPLDPTQRSALEKAYQKVPVATASDAIVPTLSQVYGDIVHATWGDHLDVVGQFHDPHGDPPHTDWLPTMSHFDRQLFETLWRDVADYALAAAA